MLLRRRRREPSDAELIAAYEAVKTKNRLAISHARRVVARGAPLSQMGLARALVEIDDVLRSAVEP